MNDKELYEQLGKLDADRSAARRDLYIQRYGSCTKCKGHFDLVSFLGGLFFGAVASVVVFVVGIVSGVIRW